MFLGWWVVLGAVLLQALHAALLVQAYGAYLPVLQADLRWSATLFAGAFSLLQAIGGLLGPLQGRLLTRLPPRAIIRLGLLLMGLSFVLFSRVDSQLGFFLTFGLIAVGYHLSGFLSLTTVVVNWFEKRRSLALALMQLGVPLGGLALPAVAWALDDYGWRMTALVSGGIILVAGLAVAGLLRGRPEDYGLRPDGEALGDSGAHRGVAGGSADASVDIDPASRAEADFTAEEALRTRAFWFVAFGHALALMVVSAVNVHAVIHMHSVLGLSLPAAAAFIALMTAFTALGQLLGGFMGDRLSKRLIAAVAMLLHAVALLALTFATGPSMVVFFAVVHGLAWGTRGPLMQAIRVDYFGRSAFAAIMGYSVFIVTIGALVGPLLAGMLFDVTGDYRLAFSLTAALAASGSLFFVFARRPERSRGV